MSANYDPFAHLPLGDNLLASIRPSQPLRPDLRRPDIGAPGTGPMASVASAVM